MLSKTEETSMTIRIRIEDKLISTSVEMIEKGDLTKVDAEQKLRVVVTETDLSPEVLVSIAALHLDAGIKVKEIRVLRLLVVDLKLLL
jgi:hypothetical protein